MSTQITDYIKALEPARRELFAARCGTTIGYLRKAVSAKQKIGLEIVLKMERESGGKIRCEDVRSDLDWSALRGSRRKRA